MKREMEVSDLSSWIADIDYLLDGTGTFGVLVIKTKRGDRYEYVDVPPEAANAIGDAVMNIENLGEDEETERTIGRVVNNIMADYGPHVGGYEAE